jgi:hypothetical protein
MHRGSVVGTPMLPQSCTENSIHKQGNASTWASTYTGQHNTEKYIHTFMSQVRSEPTILVVFEWSKANEP